MSSDLDLYKKNRKNEEYVLYNSDLNALKRKTIQNINSILRVRFRNKYYIIRSMLNQYYKNVRVLNSIYNSKIQKINNYVSEFIVNNKQITNKKALLIGINYLNTPYQLNGCIDDTTRMNELLSNYGFQKSTILTDLTSSIPTKKNIIYELRKLLINAQPNDLLFFYFSGHGSWTYDKNRDEKDGKDELIVSVDMKPVLDDEIKNIIEKNIKKNVTLIGLFDSCHSGTMCDLKYHYLNTNNDNKYTENNRVSECKGNVIMISGSMDSQTSSEAIISNKPQGAVSWAFIKGVNEKPLSSWRELIMSMRSELKNNGFNQIPQISTDSFYDIDSKIFL